MVDSNIKLNFNDYISNFTYNSKVKNYSNIDDLPNIIIYGPSGTGKYSYALNLIKQFSKSELKYYKKILITNNKSEYYLKISDIHFEIDMEVLGCNSKILWNDIYYNIIDIITNNNSGSGIILCKNFHTVNSELLDIFYSYMQKEIFCNYTIKFIICSESISFIPSSILNTTKIIRMEKYNKTYYKKNFGTSNINIDLLNNLKSLSIINNNANYNIEELNLLMNPYIRICNSIVDIILKFEEDVNFSNLRQLLYDILVYNLNIHDCIFYILKCLIDYKKIDNTEIINESILENTFIFFKYFNNNYRPIYHLENYILYLIKTVHEL
tara:strand:- start:7535 stop:8509 length:975 start_codon:yes stop_codon:yes gene_type:complete